MASSSASAEGTVGSPASRVARAWERATALASSLEGHLAVVTHGLVCHVLADTHLSIGPEMSFEGGFRNTSVSIVEAQSDALVQRVLNGSLDLAITTNTRAREAAVDPLFDEDVVAVLSPEHELAANERVTLGQLASSTLLLPLPDNPLYDHIARAFDQARVPLRNSIEVGSSALVSAMAGAGLGVALVPATAAPNSPELDGVRLPVSDLPPREVALTTRAGHAPSAAATVVAEILARTARSAATAMPGCRVRAGRNVDSA